MRANSPKQRCPALRYQSEKLGFIVSLTKTSFFKFSYDHVLTLNAKIIKNRTSELKIGWKYGTVPFETGCLVTLVLHEVK